MVSAASHFNGKLEDILKNLDEPKEGPFTQFQEEAIVSLMFDFPDFFTPIIKLFKVELFGSLNTRFVVAHILSMHKECGVMPTRHVVHDAVAKQLTTDMPHKEVLAVVARPSNYREVPFVKAHLISWVKQQTMAQLYSDEVIAAHHRGDHTMALQILDGYRSIEAGDAKDNPFAELCTAEILLAQDIDEDEDIVEGVLTKDAFGIIGGPVKSMKTGIAIDLSVSIATGSPFLGKFMVPQPKKVILCTGETRKAELKWRIERMLRSKGIGVDTLGGRLLQVPRTPKIPHAAPPGLIHQAFRTAQAGLRGLPSHLQGPVAGTDALPSDTGSRFRPLPEQFQSMLLGTRGHADCRASFQ